MAAGSLSLLEAAKYGSTTLGRGVVSTLIQESPILEMLPFTGISGNAIKVTVEDTLPSPAFRDVNETYTRSHGTDTERYFGCAILGGEVFIDNYIVRVQADQVSAKARQYSKFAKAMSRVFDKYFFDGTGTAKDFKGVNALIDDGLGQTISGGTNGSALTLDMLDQAFDALRSQSAPDALLMNRQMRRKINGLARSTYSGISLIDVGTDVFGRQVNMYNGVPVRIVGDDKDGNAILPQDQVQGSSSNNTSIYAIAFGTDENVYGILGLGGSFDVKDFGETEAAPGHLGRVEVYPGVVVSNSFSVCKLFGVQE
ncbi:MAG: phage major capsid protein [Acidimicrobiales bacterium]|nr:phage major capsid protein [Acidimicrobiales bacterium]